MTGRVEPGRMRQHLRMYLVIGSVNCTTKPSWVVQEALAGGTTMIQFREKGESALSGEAMLQFAQQMQAQCRQAGVPFIVNDDVELALKLDADGIHIGQDDESAASVRERMGNRILGVSVHTVEQARRAILAGADYLGIGPIYPTSSKSDAKAARGTVVLHEMRAAGIPLPIVAIGGITVERVQEVMEAGADGVAVISAVTGAPSVRKAVEDMVGKIAGVTEAT
ncbi:thiamine phosphate synthase [Paenibacillus sp. JCM 10914]|uniref:thiamine phosphate synthase n=1 Tax=Paenibacillus sp. JCM 10914 TaxID=1236974 RepID=UPI0003CC364B|nr:thiamine phosphate synthase [Paenibacillus sp. JCM 10914]GAE06402.1 thiamin-phosphate pyrophosphorylase [Paenibacillus sp. JCM 10914]